MVLALTIVLFGSSLAFAAEPISKQEAENNALEAVGGGEVLTSTLDTRDLTKNWKVDIAGSSNEYAVKVDATSGQILKVTSQPLTTGFISKARAEQPLIP